MTDIEKFKMDRSLVIRANKLIESRHKMSMAERRFILWNIAQTSREDTSFKPYEIGVNEYFEVLGLAPSKDAYSLVKKMHDKLTQRNIGIEYTDKKGKSAFAYYPWFSKLHYEDGKIYSQINLELKPFLLQLKAEFTTIHIEHAMILDGYYAGRMYDLLAQYKKAGQRILTIDFIKDRFQISDKYKYFKDFRIWVIEKPVKEINEKTDLEISYHWIKEGRTNVAVEFTIGTSAPTVTLQNNREEQDQKTKKIFNKLLRLGIASGVARNLIGDYSDARIGWHIEAYEKKKKRGEEVDTGWLVSGIKSDYRPQESGLDEEMSRKLETRNSHTRNCQEFERLKDILRDIEIEKSRSDIQSIKKVYERKTGDEKVKIESSFLNKIMLNNPDDSVMQDDFMKNKWNAKSCIAEIRQFWYEYDTDSFIDIADIAQRKGVNYRKTLKRMRDLRRLVER